MSATLTATTVSFLLLTTAAGVWFVLAGLTKSSKIFTTVGEGTSQAIVAGFGEKKQFLGFIMKFQGKCFDHTKSGDARWDIIDDLDPGNGDPEKYFMIPLHENWSEPVWLKSLRKTPFIRELVAGVNYIGVPPHSIMKYKFKWTSIEQDDSAEGDAVNKFVAHEKTINYVYLKEDIYGLTVQKVDLKDLMEHDLRITFRAQVMNPYKALFRVEKWLESIINRLSAEFPSYVAGLTTQSLNALKDGEGDAIDIDAVPEFKTLLESFLLEYGVKVWNIGILNSDPSGEVAVAYRAAQTDVVIAEQAAKAKKITTGAEADRIKRTYKAVTNDENGLAILSAEAVRDSGLTTLATGGTGAALALIPEKPQTPKSTDP